MRKKAYLNIICSILAQLITIISGLIVPRFMLSTFGSEANGLVSSLTQFLNYIALVEGGLGSVVLAGLYAPLAKKDEEKLSGVLNAANGFFKQIAIIFLGYVAVLAFIYPLIVESSFSRIYIASLTIILAVGLFIQYFFSITYKLLLQADQKMYIVQLLNIASSIINLIVFIVLINYWPDLHIVKLGSAMIFILQPIFYSTYVNKRYKLNKTIKPDENALSQRWACFGQNFAYFIHNNTDTVILSLFTDLKIVSVYSVYLLVVNHLKSFFQSFSHAFAPMVGKAIAKNDIDEANKIMTIYEFVVMNIATIIFGCCLYLLPSFVLLYTHGINDVDYYRPLFSIIIILAEFVCCIRTVYNDAIYAAGKFKDTAVSGYIEAGLNIALSLLLVKRYGLVGIAVGTLTGMTYRLIFFLYYISKNVLNRSILIFIKRISISIMVFIIAPFIVKVLDTTGAPTFLLWVKNGFLCVIIYSLCVGILNLLLERKMTFDMLKKLVKR